jgi:fatty-acid desaturase
MLLLIFNTWLFHGWGIVIWLIQMAWIPFWAAGVINGIGHWVGYRNEETRDRSRNIVPWGIWIGGEELHNSHHIDPSSVKFSRMKWEFDLGYAYLKMFCWLRLAQIR